jgi:hypothetical protein
VESWQKSGLTQKEFSRKHQLPLHILPYWVARYRKSRPSVAPSKQQSPPQKESPAFIRLSVPAAVAPPAACPVNDTATAVELPSGVVLRFTGLVPVAYLKELVGLSTAVC